MRLLYCTLPPPLLLDVGAFDRLAPRFDGIRAAELLGLDDARQ
jgi:hypothetical protein